MQNPNTPAIMDLKKRIEKLKRKEEESQKEKTKD